MTQTRKESQGTGHPEEPRGGPPPSHLWQWRSRKTSLRKWWQGARSQRRWELPRYKRGRHPQPVLRIVMDGSGVSRRVGFVFRAMGATMVLGMGR